jgi:FKBP-type peptidyl-prolyl cis-trans isomerase FkpA
MKQLLYIVFVVGLIFLQSCNDDEATCSKEVAADKLATVDKDRLALDIATIDTYLSANGIVAQSEPNGVRYVITTQGTGSTPCLETSITVKTTGWLLKTGTQFQPEVEFTTKLSGLIMGWQLVLPIIPAGSKVTLYIPSGYGYGVAGGANGSIPSNANLIFDIELISVN